MILFLSTNDTLGGAAMVTHRLASALRRTGVDARMLVGRKDGDDAWVAQVGSFRRKLAKVAERAEIFASNGFKRTDLWKVSTARFGAAVASHPWVAEADAIVLGWVNQGFLSLGQLERICRMKKPVVWWMHDLWCATGICHLPAGCTRYELGCGCCPLLHWERRMGDLSRFVWERKMSIFRSYPIKFLAVSRWQREQCLKGSLLRGMDIEVLGHAFPVEEFSTEPVVASDRGKLRIVMGAARLDDSVKGLPVAIEALNLLAQEHPELAARSEAVFFGGLADENAFEALRFPFRYVGRMVPDELRNLYATATVVLSTSRFETMGATLMEGMAAGATPVTFGVGGQPDIVTHGENGYIADYGSAQSVAHCLRLALESPFPRAEQHAFVASHFSEKVIATRLLRIIAAMRGE
jgi:hypothetical protein